MVNTKWERMQTSYTFEIATCAAKNVVLIKRVGLESSLLLWTRNIPYHLGKPISNCSLEGLLELIVMLRHHSPAEYSSQNDSVSENVILLS